MNISKLFGDGNDRAVSPVIGVILMVAITVILAAVIGTFVLGLGDQVQTTAPNAQFSFDFSDNDGSPDILTITHEGGDGIEAGEVAVRGDINNPGTFAERTSYGSGSSVRAGTSVEVSDGSNGYEWEDTTDYQAAPDATVRVVWEDADSDQSSTLRTWTRN